jgi:hypothetical protein
MIHRPDLCEACKENQGRAFCPNWPTTCKDQLAIWLSGFIAGKDKGFQAGFDKAVEEVQDPADRPTVPCPAPDAETVRAPAS